jgi:hypothetical protein
MTRVLASMLLLTANLLALPQTPQKVTEMELRTLMNEQRQAVVLYREGRLDAALAVLGGRSASMNHRIAERIVSWLADPQPQLRDPKKQLVQHWNVQLVGALASLHMELALRTVSARGAIEEYRAHARTARLLFNAAAKAGGGSVAALLPKWILAVGSTAHAEGHLWLAAEILDDGCQEFSQQVDLLAACGAVQETIAGLSRGCRLTSSCLVVGSRPILRPHGSVLIPASRLLRRETAVSVPRGASWSRH